MAEDLVSEEVRKDALEQESASLQRKLVSTWQSMLMCSAGVGWNFLTTPGVDGMTTSKDCWACAMVNCYLVTCEVVGQPKVVDEATGGTTTEVRVVLTGIVMMEVDGLAATLEVLGKSWNQASTDDYPASALGSQCPGVPDSLLAFLAAVPPTVAMRYCCALEVANCCCCPDCPDSA